jgi:hypothetical protein
MAGEAKTNAFMLGTATVMLGDRVDLFDLTPANHSIGLVKNFNLTVDQSYTDLGQGLTNQTVFSVKTGSKIMATMEAYEYTGKNLTYALGMEGFNADVAITASSSIIDTPSPTATGFTMTAALVDALNPAGDLVVGDYIKIQTGNNDQVLVRKVATITGAALTFVDPLPAIPAEGATVSKMNVIPLGSSTACEDTFVAAKIVGTLADCSEVVLLLPKVKVTKGFNMAFNSNDFQNLPLELTVYDLLADDDHYAAFAEFGNASAMLLTPK